VLRHFDACLSLSLSLSLSFFFSLCLYTEVITSATAPWRCRRHRNLALTTAGHTLGLSVFDGTLTDYAILCSELCRSDQISFMSNTFCRFIPPLLLPHTFYGNVYCYNVGRRRDLLRMPFGCGIIRFRESIVLRTNYQRVAVYSCPAKKHSCLRRNQGNFSTGKRGQ